MAAPLLLAAGRLLTSNSFKGTVAREVVGSALSKRQQSSSPSAPTAAAPKPESSERGIGQNPAGYQ